MLADLVTEYLKNHAGWSILEVVSNPRGSSPIGNGTFSIRFAEDYYQRVIQKESGFNSRGLGTITDDVVRVGTAVIPAADPQFFEKLDAALSARAFKSSEWHKYKTNQTFSDKRPPDYKP